MLADSHHTDCGLDLLCTKTGHWNSPVRLWKCPSLCPVYPLSLVPQLITAAGRKAMPGTAGIVFSQTLRAEQGTAWLVLLAGSAIGGSDFCFVVRGIELYERMGSCQSKLYEMQSVLRASGACSQIQCCHALVKE